MCLRLTQLFLMLKRPLSSDPGNHLLKENQLCLHKGDLLQAEGLTHLGGALIHHQFTLGKILLHSGVAEHLLA